MAKIPKLLRGKNKKSSNRKASREVEASPLMADEIQSSSSSSSRMRLRKDEERGSQETMEREERRKQGSQRTREREERRKKRGERLADSKASMKSSTKSKSNSEPKRSREEQDEEDANLGCCYNVQQILVKIVHVIDALIGLIFVVYGSVVLTSFETPAMEAVITTLTYGSTMLFTSIMGAVGFYLDACGRCGLALSAYTAPFIAFFYIFIIVAMLSSPNTYFDYLTEHKDVLYLDDAELATLKQLLPLFYIVMASLAAIETIRFLVLHHLCYRLVRFDAASKRIIAPKRSSKNKEKRRGSDRTNLTKPLIGDEEKGGNKDSNGDY